MSRLYPVLKYGAILGWSAFVVAPFLWALTTSFKTINGVTSGPRYLPWLQYEPSLQGWTSLFGGTGGIDIVQPYMDSIVVTLGASAISIVLGTLAAYGLSRFKYQLGFVKNSDIVFFFVSQRIMPPVVLAIPFFLMLQFLGLLDSALGCGGTSPSELVGSRTISTRQPGGVAPSVAEVAQGLLVPVADPRVAVQTEGE